MSACVAVSMMLPTVVYGTEPGCDGYAQEVRLNSVSPKDRFSNGRWHKFQRVEGEATVNLQANKINGIAFGGLNQILGVDAAGEPVIVQLPNLESQTGIEDPRWLTSFRIHDFRPDFSRHAMDNDRMPPNWRPYFCNGYSRGGVGSIRPWSFCIENEDYHEIDAQNPDETPIKYSRGFIEFARYNDTTTPIRPKPHYTGSLTFRIEFEQEYPVSVYDIANLNDMHMVLDYYCYTGHDPENTHGLK